MGHLCLKRGKTTLRSRLKSVLLVSLAIIFELCTVCGAHSKGAVFIFIDGSRKMVGESLYQATWVYKGLDFCDFRMCHRKRTISVLRSPADQAKLEGRSLQGSATSAVLELWFMYYLDIWSHIRPVNVGDKRAAFAFIRCEDIIKGCVCFVLT